MKKYHQLWHKKPFQQAALFIPIAIYALYIIVSVAFILYNAQFDIWDNMLFWETTYLGKVRPFSVWLNMGRFFPLGHSGYNLVLLTPFHGPTAHFTINAISFTLVAVLVFYLIFKLLPKEHRILNMWIALFGSLLLLTRIYFVFSYLIFPERVISFLILLFVFFWYKLLTTDKWIYVILSVGCAVYMTYCKEPIFATWIVFAGFLLFFEKPQTKKQKIAYVALLVNAVVFIAVYLVYVYPKINTAYNAGMSSQSIVGLFVYNLYAQKQLLLLVPILFVRLWDIVINRDRKHCFYDALLLAGLTYYLEACVLHLKDSYYITPVLVFLKSAAK